MMSTIGGRLNDTCKIRSGTISIWTDSNPSWDANIPNPDQQEKQMRSYLFVQIAPKTPRDMKEKRRNAD